jgi:8-oxo-dGTP diphosphatase
MSAPDKPRPALTVDIVTFSVRDGRLNVLLIERSKDPYAGMWALPGGYVAIEESLEEAATRVLEEETGLQEVYLEQLYTYGDPFRCPKDRVVTVAYFALIPSNAPIRYEGSKDISQVNWFPLDNLPQLAFDHQDILTYALRRLRYKLEYTAVGFELLPKVFTLSELQSTYEIILGERLDKRNFRRRILGANVIEPTPHKRTGEGRPAQLYRYRDDAVAEIKTRRLFP